MPRQLPADCLNEIFEYLEEYKFTLHSCLLVNHLWCEVSVRILWRNIWNFNCNFSKSEQLVMSSQVFNTLIACLPDESKDLLRRNRIFISTSPPLFNYTSFCKVFSINKINIMIKIFLRNQQSMSSSKLNDNDNDNQDLVTQEILKMYMKQASALKQLTYYYNKNISDSIAFTHFPGARDCLTNLSELICSSGVHSEFFYQLSQICHNIQSLNIDFNGIISNELKELITSQNCLKNLILKPGWKKILPSLTKHSNTLIKLEIRGEGPLTFITKFTNLQVLIISLQSHDTFSDFFDEVQHATFPQLQIFKFTCEIPVAEIFIKFLEINGKNLKEFYVHICDNSLNSAIAKFCPKLKSLFTKFKDNEIETLKVIFNSCQQLESVEVWCGGLYLKEKEILEIIAKYSPENFHELKLCYRSQSILLTKDLESFLISWKDRIPQKPFSIIVYEDFSIYHSFAGNNENIKIIEKYKKLGIVKKFEVE